MIKHVDGVSYFVFEHFKNTKMVRNCVSTRIGGISTGYYESMNLGVNSADDPKCVSENFVRLSHAVGWSERDIVISHQVHGVEIYDATAADRGKGLYFERDYQNIDGLMTTEKNLVLATYYADCVPLLFLDTNKRVIASVHAGWRGTLNDIGGKAVAKMIKDYGSNPVDILAGIGPSISVKNFQVGADVYEEFQKALPFSADFIYNDKKADDRRYLDLWGINRRLLELAGIPPENIEVAGLCTYERDDLFFSHRRDGAKRGSIAAMIELY